jgi:predicted ArsR family transcriptional regulator
MNRQEAPMPVNLANSQQQILQQLKSRGPQTVKILAKRLAMTTMGARQHLTELGHLGLVRQTDSEKQTRGRPVHLWKLTAQGHGYFPDAHAEITVELITLIRDSLGEPTLNQLIEQRGQQVMEKYREALESADPALPEQLACLAELRSREGYMAEVRLLPNEGWLLIENHCPICAAAQSCQQFCRSELEMFQTLLAPNAAVERVDYLLAGARRCAYRITPQSLPTSSP